MKPLQWQLKTDKEGLHEQHKVEGHLTRGGLSRIIRIPCQYDSNQLNSRPPLTAQRSSNKTTILIDTKCNNDIPVQLYTEASPYYSPTKKIAPETDLEV